MKPDTFGDYLRSIGRHPLLTAAEEIELARLVQRRQELTAAAETRKLTKQEQHQLRRGDKAARRMIEANLRLVVSIAKQMINSRSCKSLETMDLISLGNMGLATAVEKFDHTRGYKFSTYAYWWVRQSISRGIQMEDRMIRIPCHALESETKLRRVLARMASLNQPISLEAAAAEVGIPLDIAQRILVLQSVSSLDAPAPNGDSDTELVGLVADEQQAPDDFLLEWDPVEDIEELLQHLDEQTQQLVCRKYGLRGYQPSTYKELAKDWKLSRERLRQIVDSGLRRMRVLHRNGGARLTRFPQAV